MRSRTSEMGSGHWHFSSLLGRGSTHPLQLVLFTLTMHTVTGHRQRRAQQICLPPQKHQECLKGTASSQTGLCSKSQASPNHIMTLCPPNPNQSQSQTNPTKTKAEEAPGAAQQLGTLPASVPRSHMGLLTVTCNSSSRGPFTLFSFAPRGT